MMYPTLNNVYTHTLHTLIDADAHVARGDGSKPAVEETTEGGVEAKAGANTSWFRAKCIEWFKCIELKKHVWVNIHARALFMHVL